MSTTTAAPDLPGYGWSGPAPHKWAKDDVATDVLALMAEVQRRVKERSGVTLEPDTVYFRCDDGVTTIKK